MLRKLQELFELQCDELIFISKLKELSPLDLMQDILRILFDTTWKSLAFMKKSLIEVRMELKILGHLKSSP